MEIVANRAAQHCRLTRRVRSGDPWSFINTSSATSEFSATLFNLLSSGISPRHEYLPHAARCTGQSIGTSSTTFVACSNNSYLGSQHATRQHLQQLSRIQKRHQYLHYLALWHCIKHWIYAALQVILGIHGVAITVPKEEVRRARSKHQRTRCMCRGNHQETTKAVRRPSLCRSVCGTGYPTTKEVVAMA